MVETWFTSDSHFGHKNILEYEKQARPFETIEEMHTVLIDRWNSVVKPKDTVYHLGDFAFGRHNIAIAERLHGRKRLVMGNHDTYPTVEYLRYFDKLYGVMFWNRCILSHIPVHPDDLGSRCMLNVHGHLHSRVVLLPALYSQNVWTNPEGVVSIFPERTPDKNYFNVSVEQNNLTPIHADVILKRLEDL